MKGAAQWGFVAVLTGVLVVFGSEQCRAQPAEKAPVAVTDADRVFRNFTRESATVERNQIRVEVRGLRTEEKAEGGRPDCRTPDRADCARLNTIGQRVLGVEEVKGGIIDLVGSYGLITNTEVGFILPFIIETVELDTGKNETRENFGDVLFYGKYKQPIGENFSVAGGLELTAPTGDETETRTLERRFSEGGSVAARGFSAFGAGSVGLNPFVSARFTWYRVGVGANVGYNFYTNGDDVPEVFNYGAYGIIRGTEQFALRVEFAGRVFDQFGERYSDVVFMPGIDFNLSENFVIRPEGLGNVTGTAHDWGVGIGIAGVF
jgi:hypothetical protein